MNELRYQRGTKLGDGRQGDVYRGTGPRGEPVALKYLQMGTSDEDVQETRRAVAIEVHALRAIFHPCIVRLLGSFEEHFEGNATNRGHLVLVFELVEGEHLGRYRLAPGERTALLESLLELADAIDMLHARRLLHRDIKPQNIIRTRDRLVLVDFGHVKLEGTRGKTRSAKGTNGYLPPDADSPTFAPSPTSDVWAFAVVVAQVLVALHTKIPVEAVSLDRNYLLREVERLEGTRAADALRRAWAEAPAPQVLSCGTLIRELAADTLAATDETPRSLAGGGDFDAVLQEAIRRGKAERRERALRRARPKLDPRGPYVVEWLRAQGREVIDKRPWGAVWVIGSRPEIERLNAQLESIFGLRLTPSSYGVSDRRSAGYWDPFEGS